MRLIFTIHPSYLTCICSVVRMAYFLEQNKNEMKREKSLRSTSSPYLSCQRSFHRTMLLCGKNTPYMIVFMLSYGNYDDNCYDLAKIEAMLRHSDRTASLFVLLTFSHEVASIPWSALGCRSDGYVCRERGYRLLVEGWLACACCSPPSLFQPVSSVAGNLSQQGEGEIYCYGIVRILSFSRF